MILQQRSPSEFAPQMAVVASAVFDAAPTINLVTHRQFVFNEETGSAGHLQYSCSGENLENLAVSRQTIPNGVDLSEFPIIQRANGINANVSATFTNGRGTTGFMEFSFANFSGSSSYISSADSVVEDTYAEYSLQRVAAIFDALESPEMFDANKDRKLPLVIPHTHLTGHVFNGGGWGNAAGKRFSAVTPRHVVGCAHYVYNIGDTVQFKTADNAVITRTIQGRWSGLHVTPEVGVFPGRTSDFSLYLLNDNLPESIEPFQVVGDWYLKLQEGWTSSVFTACPQGFGIILYNNDGHIRPFIAASTEDTAYSGSSVVCNGVTLTLLDFVRPSGITGYTLTGYEEWMNLSTNPFYHDVRGGDSGSPVLIPVANDKWALAGIISGAMYSASAMNNLIAWLDDDVLGVSTGHTVVEAFDPTA